MSGPIRTNLPLGLRGSPAELLFLAHLYTITMTTTVRTMSAVMNIPQSFPSNSKQFLHTGAKEGTDE